MGSNVDITTIRLKKQIKERLEAIKIIPRESYESVIVRLLEMYESQEKAK